MSKVSVQPPNKSNKRWQQIFLRLIGLALFIWILSRVDLPQTFATLVQADKLLVLGGILMAVPIVLTRSWRLKIVLRKFGMDLSLKQTLLIRLVGTAAGDMLPGRTGELITVSYLHQSGHGLRDPIFALLIDRLFDFVILVFCAIAGFSLIGEKINQQVNSVQTSLIVVGFILVIIIGALFYLRSRLELLKQIFNALLPERWREKFNSWINQNTTKTEIKTKQFSAFDAGLIATVFGTSLMSFIFLLSRGYLMARAIGINLSFSYLSVTMAFATLAQLIPVSNVMGVGTREVSVVYLFGLAGVSGELAVGFSFLIVIALLVQDAIGLILWLRYPVGSSF